MNENPPASPDVMQDEMLLELVADLLAHGRPASFIAHGSSMRPLIRDGDKVLVRPLDASRLKPGMVVLDLPPLPNGQVGMLIHRFLGALPDGRLILRGDAAPVPDPPVRPDTVAGQVIEVQRGGRTLRASSWTGRLLLARGILLPRLLASLARLRSWFRGPSRLPFLSTPLSRLLRERWLVRMALGHEDPLAQLEQADQPFQVMPHERDVLPLLLWRADEADLDPDLLPSRGEEIRLEALQRLAKMQTALDWLAAVLADGREQLLLAGSSSLALQHYPAAHCRPLGPIECLLRPARRQAVTELLLGHGAALAHPVFGLSSTLRFSHSLCLRLPGPGWPLLRLQWADLAPPGFGPAQIERFWEGRHDSPFGSALGFMDIEGDFVHALLMVARHLPRLRLLWAVDLLLLAQAAPAWDDLAAWLRDDGLALPGALVCDWMDRLAPAVLPQGFTERLAAHAAEHAGAWQKRLLFAPHPFSCRLLAALQQPGLFAKAGLLRRLLFPDRKMLERMCPAHRRRSLPVLHLVHLLRFVRPHSFASSPSAGADPYVPASDPCAGRGDSGCNGTAPWLS